MKKLILSMIMVLAIVTSSFAFDFTGGSWVYGPLGNSCGVMSFINDKNKSIVGIAKTPDGPVNYVGNYLIKDDRIYFVFDSEYGRRTLQNGRLVWLDCNTFVVICDNGIKFYFVRKYASK